MIAIATLLTGAVVVSGTAAHAAPADPHIDVSLGAPDGLAATGDIGYPVLSWLPLRGATSYEVEVDDDATFASPTLSTSTVNVSYAHSSALAAGTQSWRVRAVAGGTTGPWSASQVDVPRTATPRPVAPADGTVLAQPDEPPLLEWSKVLGTTSYVVQLDDENGFVQPREYKTESSSLVLPDPLAPDQSWFWRVKAVRGTGIDSAFSPHQSFRIGALSVPEVVGPDSSPDNDLTDVVLDWHPVPGARYYDLEVSTDDDFATSTIVDSRTRLTGTRYSPAVTYDNNQYFWRVRAVSSDAAVKSAWSSSANQFRRSWPHRPDLVHPAAGATAVGDPFFYEWTPVPHATLYQLQVSSSPLFDTGVKLCLTAGTTYTPGARVVRDPLAAGGLTADETGCQPFVDGQTYWRVRALDRPFRIPGVQGIFSEVRTFDYVASPPATGSFGPVGGQRVALTGTAATTTGHCDGAIDPATRVATFCDDLPATPVYAWDPVPGADYYMVYVSNDDKFTNLLEYAATTSTLWSPSNEAVHPAVPESQAGASYYWFVRPCRLGTCGSASPISVTPSMATNVFRKRSPGVVGGTATAGTGDDTEITFAWDDYARTNGRTTWNGSGPAATSHQTAQAYRVEVSDTASFTTLLDAAVVDQTTYTAPARLYPDGTVYWRVRAIDAADNDLAWSATWSWSKTGPEVRLSSPADGAKIGASIPLEWEALAHAQAYEVQVAAADDATFSRDHLLFTERTAQTAYTWDEVVPASQVPYVWRVRRIDSVGNLGAWSAVRRFVNPPLDPGLLTPGPDANVPAARALFTWSFVPGATSYKVEITQGTRTTTWSTTGNAYAPTSAFSTGTRQWRVVALDAARDQVGASEPRTFRVEAPIVVTVPVVEGTGKVDTDLHAVAATFDPGAESVAYQWLRTSSPAVAPTAIDGATAQDYPIRAADLGSYLSVRATGSRDGYPDAAATSAPVRVVQGDASVSMLAPTITGTSRVGELLTAGRGTWSGSPALGYQWFRDGAVITGATAVSYRLVAADLGRAIHVVETATIPGHTAGSAASGTVTPTVGTAPATVSAPRLAAAPAVTAGDTVTVNTGAWSPSTGLTFGYQWLRDDEPIAGATSSSYRLTTSDVGRAVSAAVTASSPGRESGTASTAAIVPNGAIVADEAPAVTGDPISGHTLTASSGQWPSTVQARFQWFVDGVAATSPATTPTYVLRSSDIGHAVHVRVLATAAGYLPGTAESRTVAVTSEGPALNQQRPTVTGNAAPGSALRVTPGDWSTEATFTYQWLRDNAPVPGATGASYAVTIADAGRRLAVLVTATAEHWDQGVAGSNVVAVAKAASATAVSLSAVRTTTTRRVTATFTVRAVGLATPVGTVTVYDGTRRLAALKLTSSRAVYRLPRLGVGAHVIRAVYGGTSQVAASTRTARLVVTRG